MTFVTNNYLNIAVQKYASPELADIDGDGDLDLFVGRSSSGGQSPTQGDLFFYRNDGTPQSADFRFITSNYLAWDCGYASGPRLVDINGDGLPDLLSRTGSHLIYYKNVGTAGYPDFIYQSSSYGGISLFDVDPWFVDINSDGLPDIIAGTSAIPGPPTLKLYLNQGTPQVPNWVLWSNDLVPGVFTTYSAHLAPWTADIDADGAQDLFATDDTGHLYFFHNIGTPTNYQFQYVTNNWQNLTATFGAHRYGCFYDIDGNATLDLFMSKEDYYWNPFDKNLCFYRNVGTPQNANLVLENDDLFPDQMIWQAAPFLIDMDQDGDGDLFVGDSWGGIRYFKNVTGDTSAVGPPPVQRHPRAGLQISLGPNPANPITVVSCQFLVPSNISLQVFDISGRMVVELASGFHLPGEYRYVWDASDRAAGMYFVRLRAEEYASIQKMVLLK
jgi:hypothetical protein